MTGNIARILVEQLQVPTFVFVRVVNSSIIKVFAAPFQYLTYSMQTHFSMNTVTRIVISKELTCDTCMGLLYITVIEFVGHRVKGSVKVVKYW
jgi:hypothetical protein